MKQNTEGGSERVGAAGRRRGQRPPKRGAGQGRKGQGEKPGDEEGEAKPETETRTQKRLCKSHQCSPKPCSKSDGFASNVLFTTQLRAKIGVNSMLEAEFRGLGGLGRPAQGVWSRSASVVVKRAVKRGLAPRASTMDGIFKCNECAKTLNAKGICEDCKRMATSIQCEAFAQELGRAAGPARRRKRPLARIKCESTLQNKILDEAWCTQIRREDCDLHMPMQGISASRSLRS